MTFTERIDELLDKYGAELTSEMRTRLQGHQKEATGTLLNSIGYEVRESAPGVSELAIFMADYGIYVDKGRKPGKMPPVSAIREWCKVKGIPEKAAFPIARNIGRFGIPATNFYTIPITRRAAQFQEKISKLTAEFAAKEIKESFQ